ncbi:sodium/substrate symporter small subunit [Cytobacillus sp. IB215665]|uniref:DUF4212 domain-containing protein n=1 Tax=Cytobacillus sp. IB215665 TaxID=3097357 RepID=UPI002A0B7765|nr:sodium/substrate symporter small subunit [Cytobacillus sp. IB215665]MDX8366824.1 DUF4212 domain-containing protein [Cytobacillus sp. IB215665]
MKKLDKQNADSYFRKHTRNVVIYLVIWLMVSFGVVFFAETLQFNINGFPFHYFMGAQGSILIFILLLFINARVSDKLDEKYGFSTATQQLDKSMKSQKF